MLEATTVTGARKLPLTASFIAANLHRDLPLKVLAAQANYSPHHFHRLFTAQSGETPRQYVTRLRLERAVHDLVLFPEKSVAAIAFDAGFSSPAVFARAFGHRFGVPALAYRRRAKLRRITGPGNAMRCAEYSC